MSLSYLKGSSFHRIIKQFCRKEKEKILDVVLFGSTVRGKAKPNDIDVLLLFSQRVDNDSAYRLRKRLEKELGITIQIQITSKTYCELFSSTFLARESILAEGRSILTGKRLSESFGYTSYTLIKYSLKGLSKSEKMQFYYALHGRKTEGVLKTTGSTRFSESVLLVPTRNVDAVLEFFSHWNIEIRKSVVLIPAGNEKKLA